LLTVILCLRAAARTFRPRQAIPLYIVAPCLLLWLLCQVFGALPHRGGFPVPTYLAFLAPALAVAAALPATLFTGLALLEDRDTGLLEQMLVTPSASVIVFLAAAAAAASAGMAMAAVIVLAGLVGGLQISGSLAGAAAIVLLAGLLGLTGAGISLLLGILVPQRALVRNAGACILAIGLLCSTLLLPRSLLPNWLLNLALLNPAASAIDGARAVCWPGPAWAQYERDLLLLLVTALLSLSLASVAIVRHPGAGLTIVRQ